MTFGHFGPHQRYTIHSLTFTQTVEIVMNLITYHLLTRINTRLNPYLLTETKLSWVRANIKIFFPSKTMWYI